MNIVQDVWVELLKALDAWIDAQPLREHRHHHKHRLVRVSLRGRIVRNDGYQQGLEVKTV